MLKKQEKDMTCLDMSCPNSSKKIPPHLGLALSGGGALGAYQIGVWKALQELNLTQHIKIIAGTSIGAINGALIAQGDFHLLEKMWKEMKPWNIFSVFQSISSSDAEEMKPMHYLSLAKELVTKGKIDISPFKKLLAEVIDEDRIRKAPIQFALNTWNIFKFRGEQYLLSEIPEGKLVDFIIASASFPLFWPHQVADNYYLDGGIDLNLPIDIPFEKAAVGHVIAVDVALYLKYRPKQLWKIHKHKENLSLIRPSKLLGSPVNFSSKMANKQIILGYQDTLSQLEKSPY